MLTYKANRTASRIPAWDIMDGGKYLATVHSFDVVQTVCREIASRHARAAAQWATGEAA